MNIAIAMVGTFLVFTDGVLAVSHPALGGTIGLIGGCIIGFAVMRGRAR